MWCNLLKINKMKKGKLGIFILLLVFMIPSLNVNRATKMVNLIFHKNTTNEVTDTEKFLKSISFKESRGNHRAVSVNGYLGKYQFTPKTLELIDFNISYKKFLRSEKLQDSAMITLLSHNRKLLRREIVKFNNKKINGKRITESGILAGAHLAGPYRVKKYLTEGVDFADDNGVKISHYIKKFSGYELDIDTN